MVFEVLHQLRWHPIAYKVLHILVDGFHRAQKALVVRPHGRKKISRKDRMFLQEPMFPWTMITWRLRVAMLSIVNPQIWWFIRSQPLIKLSTCGFTSTIWPNIYYFTNLDFPGCPFFGEVVRGRYNLTRTILLTIFNKSLLRKLLWWIFPNLPPTTPNTYQKRRFCFKKNNRPILLKNPIFSDFLMCFGCWTSFYPKIQLRSPHDLHGHENPMHCAQHEPTAPRSTGQLANSIKVPRCVFNQIEVIKIDICRSRKLRLTNGLSTKNRWFFWFQKISLINGAGFLN